MSRTVVIRVGSAEHARRDLKRDLVAIELGELVVRTREIWFSSLGQLAAMLTEPRLGLLRLIRRKRPQSVGGLARLAGRSMRSVEADLQILIASGFVTLVTTGKSKRPVAEYDRIHLAGDIAIARAAA